MHVCGIFVDIQKAFDAVNQQNITWKLSHYGIRGIENDWFSSYLSNRTKYVSILGFESKIMPVPHVKMQKQINLDLKSLYKWLLANKISLNCSKTELIFFHTPHGPVPDLRIKMNGLIIHPSSYIKYLGVYLDATLSGNHHCGLLVKKLKIANCMLSKFRHYVPRE